MKLKNIVDVSLQARNRRPAHSSTKDQAHSEPLQLTGGFPLQPEQDQAPAPWPISSREAPGTGNLGNLNTIDVFVEPEFSV